MRWGLAIVAGASALAACGGREAGDGPVGVAVEAVGAKPVIDYPSDFAKREKVPPVMGWARLAAHGDGYLAAWTEFGQFSQQIEATFLGADGAPLRSSPFSFGFGVSLFDAACAPGGDCLVLFDAGGSVGLSVTWVTEAGASKPFRIKDGSLPDGRVAFDPAAAAFVVAWSDGGLLERHFKDGAPIEAKPLQLAPTGATLEGLACSQADGCLAAYWNGQPMGAMEGVIVTATAVTPPVQLPVPRLSSLTWGGGIYLAVAPASDGIGFAFSRLGVDGAALDAAPQSLTFSEPASVLAGAGFDGEAFNLLAYDRNAPSAGCSGVRVLPDGTPATPAGIKLDGLGVPFALACGDESCAAAVDFDPDHERGLSAVPIKDGVPAAPQAIHELAGQTLEAAFPFGDQALVVWNENSVVRTCWFANDATAASPVVDIGSAAFVESGTADQNAGLLVAFRDDDLSWSARVVTSAGVGDERRFDPPATTIANHARFAWLEESALNGLSLHRFDADGRVLDAHPMVIVEPKKLEIPYGNVARSGDLFVVVTDAGKAEITVTRVRDTGEILDQTTLPHAFLRGLACSPTACLMGEEGQLGPQQTKPIEAHVVRFASHADTLAFEVSRLDTGAVEQIAWDGARFLVSYVDDGELGMARIDGDGTAIGRRVLEGDIPSFLTPLADGRALLFAQLFTSRAGRLVELADVSLVLVDGFPGGGPPPPGDSGDGVVASGGACAVAPGGGASSKGDASTIGALLLAAAAALRFRARRAFRSVSERPMDRFQSADDHVLAQRRAYAACHHH